MTFLGDNVISLMNWLTMSPDHNTIGHNWGILSRRIQQRPYHLDNVQNIIDALVQRLQSISQKRIMIMPRRCEECGNDRGGHTSYW